MRGFAASGRALDGHLLDLRGNVQRSAGTQCASGRRKGVRTVRSSLDARTLTRRRSHVDLMLLFGDPDFVPWTAATFIFKFWEQVLVPDVTLLGAVGGMSDLPMQKALRAAEPWAGRYPIHLFLPPHGAWYRYQWAAKGSAPFGVSQFLACQACRRLDCFKVTGRMSDAGAVTRTCLCQETSVQSAPPDWGKGTMLSHSEHGAWYRFEVDDRSGVP